MKALYLAGNNSGFLEIVFFNVEVFFEPVADRYLI